MATETIISPRTGKPKRKYTRRTVKSAAPKPEPKPQEPTEEPTVLSNEEMAEITSRNIIPGLKDGMEERHAQNEAVILQSEEDIKKAQAVISEARVENETINRALKVLK